MLVIGRKYSSTPHPAGRFLFVSKTAVPGFGKEISIYSYHIASWAVSRKSRHLVNCDRNLFLDAALNESSPLPQVSLHNIPDLFVINQINIDRIPSQKNFSQGEVVLRNFLEWDVASVK